MATIEKLTYNLSVLEPTNPGDSILSGTTIERRTTLILGSFNIAAALIVIGSILWDARLIWRQDEQQGKR